MSVGCFVVASVSLLFLLFKFYQFSRSPIFSLNASHSVLKTSSSSFKYSQTDLDCSPLLLLLYKCYVPFTSIHFYEWFGRSHSHHHCVFACSLYALLSRPLLSPFFPTFYVFPAINIVCTLHTSFVQFYTVECVRTQQK